MKVFSTGWSDGFDGPGHRWVIYARGCNFNCRWCANPEGLAPSNSILYYPDRAPYAHKACPNGAFGAGADPEPALDGSGSKVPVTCDARMPVELNRDKCPTCPDRPCITTWKHPSFEPVEFEQSTAGLIEKASRYKPLMAGGGVTFGGGEPTIQMDELCEILPELRARGIHTAVETNASHPTLPRLFGMADLLICDLKCISMELHRIWTGHENDSVLKNLRAAVKSGIPLLVRVTLVPGFNDGYEEISIISGFLAELKQLRGTLSVEILKFHHLGRPKYLALGLDYPMEGACQNLETAGELINLLANSGIHA